MELRSIIWLRLSILAGSKFINVTAQLIAICDLNFGNDGALLLYYSSYSFSSIWYSSSIPVVDVPSFVGAFNGFNVDA